MSMFVVKYVHCQINGDVMDLSVTDKATETSNGNVTKLVYFHTGEVPNLVPCLREPCLGHLYLFLGLVKILMKTYLFEKSIPKLPYPEIVIA